jgi:hypothetical protein
MRGEQLVPIRFHALTLARTSLILIAAGAAACAVTFVRPAHGAPMAMRIGSAATMSMHGAMASSRMGDASLRTRFAFLSHQTSNTCNLQASGLAAMPATARLQGSCCSPMVYASYVKQIHELARYSDSDIPRDPYDMSVPLARKLIAYNEQILLTDAQQRTYNAAMRKAEEGGPCCCHCWRWTAFEGQAKVLIVRRRYTADQLAELWDAEDGCGGDGSSNPHASMMTPGRG